MLRQKELVVDLCVVGGGMAGICTAIASARHGIKVALVQERPVLGGNASSEVRMWVCGAHGENNRETGILEEIMLENLARNPTKNFYIWDSILMDFVQREENITLLMNTTCMDAEIEKGNFAHGRTTRITAVRCYQLTTQTFYRITATLFADCSGDSILAPLSGAEYMYGRESASTFGETSHVTESDNMVMGMSCLIQGRETITPVRFTPSERITKLTDEDVKNRPMDPYRSDENFWYLELGGMDDTIHDAEKTKDKLIPLALGTWDYLKNSGNYQTENWDLEFLGFLPAKRESRRMKGEYIVTQKDISEGRIFEDTVAFGGWPLDDHYPAGYYHHGTPNTDYHTPAPYCLPYRALYSANVENLFFAGRNISMTHTAMSSVRVMATCALLGQAVGTASAIAVKEKTTPHGVYLHHLKELQAHLLNDDCFLPHFDRPRSPLCLSTKLCNGTETLKNGRDRDNHIYEGENGATVEAGTSLTYRFDTPSKINAVHITFDSDLDRKTLPGDFCERGHVTRANVLLSSPQMHLPTTLCKSFRLSATIDGKETTIYETDNNIRRSYHLPLNRNVTALSLTLNSDWGNHPKIHLYSFDFT